MTASHRGLHLLLCKAVSLAFVVLVIGAILECSGKPAYPKCARDQDCAVLGKHDYCVVGACVYCRSMTDCGEREICRAGACLLDPDLQPKDAGAQTDAAPEIVDEPLPPRRRRMIRIQDME